MNKIKIISGLIFLLSITLAVLSHTIAQKNRENILFLEKINQQKAFTQEVAKSIFYIYKTGDNSSNILKVTIDKFLKENNNRFLNIKVSKITLLWNRFYLDVDKFLKEQKFTTPYSSIILDRLVNEIYTINLDLILAFDKLIDTKEIEYYRLINRYKNLQRVLFILLFVLLIYLFTQIRDIISFICKFSKTSKTIIKNSTIKGIEPLTIESKEDKLQEVTKNYNYLVEKINRSIEYANKSIVVTIQSIESVEQNIEDFMELLASMENKNSDEIFKKEDIIIESLETLISLKDKLNNLQFLSQF